MFDRFLPALDTTGPKSFADMVASFPFDLLISARGAFATFSTTALTPRFLEAVKDEAAVGWPLGFNVSCRLTLGSGHRQDLTPPQRHPSQF